MEVRLIYITAENVDYNHLQPPLTRLIFALSA